MLKCSMGQPTPLEEYCATLSGREGSKPSSPMLFPMHVVRVNDLLRMTEALPHQVLKKQGVVEPYVDQKHGVAVFVSHQWCSYVHPDPNFEQLLTLQALLRRMAVGDVEVEPDFSSMMIWRKKSTTVKKGDLQPLASGCVWYDYFSVPQPGAPMAQSDQHVNLEEDMGRAVFSIPAYVASCRFFLVLAPPVFHMEFPEQVVDYHSWKQRGWCRLERIARVLSPQHTHILLAWKADTVFELGIREFLLDSVGDGEFTVDADRARLAPLVVSLMERKLQALLQQGDLCGYRWMLCTRSSILRGLPGVEPHAVSAPGFQVPLPPATAGSEEWLQAFLHLYGLRSVADTAGMKAEPILLAARDGNTAVVKALLERRANVNAAVGVNDPKYNAIKGSTALHFAALFHAEPSVVNLLIEHRADIMARQRKAIIPLMSAAFAGRPANIAALLAARANVSDGGRIGIKLTALHCAAMLGRVEACKHLLKAGASAAPNSFGLGPVMLAAMLGGSAAVIEALTSSEGGDPDRALSQQWTAHPAGAFFAATLSLPHRLFGSRSVFAIFGYEAFGITPLMAASLMGHLGEARALVKAGANVWARNAHGRTAADLALVAGLPRKVVAYLRDPEEAERQASAASSLRRQSLQESAGRASSSNGHVGSESSGPPRHAVLRKDSAGRASSSNGGQSSIFMSESSGTPQHAVLRKEAEPLPSTHTATTSERRVGHAYPTEVQVIAEEDFN